MSSRSLMWSSAPGLIQPTRSWMACSTVISRWWRARAAWPPKAAWASSLRREPPCQPDSGGPRTEAIAARSSSVAGTVADRRRSI